MLMEPSGRISFSTRAFQCCSPCLVKLTRYTEAAIKCTGYLTCFCCVLCCGQWVSLMF
jgi:hypothetical protein